MLSVGPNTCVQTCVYMLYRLILELIYNVIACLQIVILKSNKKIFFAGAARRHPPTHDTCRPKLSLEFYRTDRFPMDTM